MWKNGLILCTLSERQWTNCKKLKTETSSPRGESVLSNKVIDYLGKCFSYSVAQNAGNTDNLQKAIRLIDPHAFGNHEHYLKSWCGYKQDPVNYKYRDLPFGKDLVGESLKKSLKEVFEIYSSENVIKKIPHNASLQRNESLNSTVGSKNPKYAVMEAGWVLTREWHILLHRKVWVNNIFWMFCNLQILTRGAPWRVGTKRWPPIRTPRWTPIWTPSWPLPDPFWTPLWTTFWTLFSFIFFSFFNLFFKDVYANLIGEVQKNAKNEFFFGKGSRLVFTSDGVGIVVGVIRELMT